MLHADPGFPCLIGNRVTVGHRTILHGCVVEDGCMIGMGSILLNGVKVGRAPGRAGASSIEGTVIPPGVLVVGSPAWRRPSGRRRRARAAPQDLGALRRAGRAAPLRGVPSLP
ncbi:MAG: hypothetical protein U0835_15845 [Isosphaeraceae bacterium]